MTDSRQTGSDRRRFGERLRRLAAVVGHAVWPPTCVICSRASDQPRDWCRACAAALPLAAGQCRRCGLELPRSVGRCGRCVAAPPAFDRTHAAFVYTAPVAGLVQRFKFDGDPVAGRVLAELMAHRLRDAGAVRPELLVPVPLNWRREWHRGFNQAEWLCRDLARQFGSLPWAPALSRRRATAAQSDLPATRRAANVRGAFELRALPRGARHVALVDDVMTTGTTLGECARTLKRAGVRRVDIWVAARA